MSAIGNLLKTWWARGDSNARPLPCQGRKINHLQAALYENKRLSGHRFGRQTDAKGQFRGVLDSEPTPQADRKVWYATCFARTRAVVTAFSMSSCDCGDGDKFGFRIHEENACETRASMPVIATALLDPDAQRARSQVGPGHSSEGLVAR